MRSGLSLDSMSKLAFLLLLTLAPLLLPVEAVGATYDESGWYIYSDSDPKRLHFADIRATYSVPDRVEKGSSFEVDASLTYINNKRAYCEWLEFYDVSVHLRRSRLGEDSASALDTSRVRARPGQQYAHRFSLTAPTELGEYYVTLTWNTTNPSARLASLREPGDPQSAAPVELNAKQSSWDTGKEEDQMKLPRIGVEGVESTLTFQVTLDTEPDDVNLTVNGTLYAGGSLPQTFEWVPESVHILQVNETVEVRPGVRSVFVEWSDGSKETSRAIRASQTVTYTARFKTQYELKVVSDIGDPQGAGWYDAGTEATVSVDSPQPETGLMGSLGATKVFQEWSGDLSSDSRTAKVKMDDPKTVEAKWTTDNSQAYVVLGGIAAVGLVIVAAFMLTRRRRRSRPQIKPLVITPPRAPRPSSVTRAPTTYPLRSPAGVKHCIHCGATIPSVVLFCTECGKKQHD